MTALTPHTVMPHDPRLPSRVMSWRGSREDYVHSALLIAFPEAHFSVEITRGSKYKVIPPKVEELLFEILGVMHDSKLPFQQQQAASSAPSQWAQVTCLALPCVIDVPFLQELSQRLAMCSTSLGGRCRLRKISCDAAAALVEDASDTTALLSGKDVILHADYDGLLCTIHAPRLKRLYSQHVFVSPPCVCLPKTGSRSSQNQQSLLDLLDFISSVPSDVPLVSDVRVEFRAPTEAALVAGSKFDGFVAINEEGTSAGSPTVFHYLLDAKRSYKDLIKMLPHLTAMTATTVAASAAPAQCPQPPRFRFVFGVNRNGEVRGAPTAAVQRFVGILRENRIEEPHRFFPPFSNVDIWLTRTPVVVTQQQEHEQQQNEGKELLEISIEPRCGGSSPAWMRHRCIWDDHIPPSVPHPLLLWFLHHEKAVLLPRVAALLRSSCVLDVTKLVVVTPTPPLGYPILSDEHREMLNVQEYSPTPTVLVIDMDATDNYNGRCVRDLIYWRNRVVDEVAVRLRENGLKKVNVKVLIFDANARRCMELGSIDPVLTDVCELVLIPLTRADVHARIHLASTAATPDQSSTSLTKTVATLFGAQQQNEIPATCAFCCDVDDVSSNEASSTACFRRFINGIIPAPPSLRSRVRTRDVQVKLVSGALYSIASQLTPGVPEVRIAARQPLRLTGTTTMLNFAVMDLAQEHKDHLVGVCNFLAHSHAAEATTTAATLCSFLQQVAKIVTATQRQEQQQQQREASFVVIVVVPSEQALHFTKEQSAELSQHCSALRMLIVLDNSAPVQYKHVKEVLEGGVAGLLTKGPDAHVPGVNEVGNMFKLFSDRFPNSVGALTKLHDAAMQVCLPRDQQWLWPALWPLTARLNECIPVSEIGPRFWQQFADFMKSRADVESMLLSIAAAQCFSVATNAERRKVLARIDRSSPETKKALSEAMEALGAFTDQTGLLNRAVAWQVLETSRQQQQRQRRTGIGEWITVVRLWFGTSIVRDFIIGDRLKSERDDDNNNIGAVSPLLAFVYQCLGSQDFAMFIAEVEEQLTFSNRHDASLPHYRRALARARDAVKTDQSVTLTDLRRWMDPAYVV